MLEYSYKEFLKLICAILIFLSNSSSYAFTNGIGLSFMEENDNRFRPGMSADFDIKHFQGKFFYFARSFGPVFDQCAMISTSSKFALPMNKKIFASIGSVILQELTEIKYNDQTDKIFNQKDNKFNLGLFLGLNWSFEIWKDWHIGFSWDSAIFPAGIIGGILLSSGRKQVLSASMGYQW